MASRGRRLQLLTLCLAMLLAVAVATAPAPAAGMVAVAERLQGEESQQCWGALMEVRSYIGEIVLFFLNGEAYLGPGCCRAIRVVEQRCWAADAVLSAVGFTPEEGDMLKGYCDAGVDGDGVDGRPPPVAPPTRRALDGGSPATAAGWKGSIGA